MFAGLLIFIALISLAAMGMVIGLMALTALFAGLCRLLRAIFRKVLA